MDPDGPAAAPSAPPPPAANYIISFLLVSFCWGFTTPFIRRAAVSYTARPQPALAPGAGLFALARSKVVGALYAVWDLLRAPAYALPLLANVTGSVWFFVLVGQAELSLTVPIVNSLAFLWTVVGEWWAEGKGVGRDTWIGMVFVVAGIALCVQSKN